jgi:hypothetical protein
VHLHSPSPNCMLQGHGKVSPPSRKKGSARYGFLTPIKIHSPRPDRNQQQRVPWVPVARTLTTRPPKAPACEVTQVNLRRYCDAINICHALGHWPGQNLVKRSTWASEGRLCAILRANMLFNSERILKKQSDAEKYFVKIINLTNFNYYNFNKVQFLQLLF